MTIITGAKWQLLPLLKACAIQSVQFVTVPTTTYFFFHQYTWHALLFFFFFLNYLHRPCHKVCCKLVWKPAGAVKRMLQNYSLHMQKNTHYCSSIVNVVFTCSSSPFK